MLVGARRTWQAGTGTGVSALTQLRTELHVLQYIEFTTPKADPPLNWSDVELTHTVATILVRGRRFDRKGLRQFCN